MLFAILVATKTHFLLLGRQDLMIAILAHETPESPSTRFGVQLRVLYHDVNTSPCTFCAHTGFFRKREEVIDEDGAIFKGSALETCERLPVGINVMDASLRLKGRKRWTNHGALDVNPLTVACRELNASLGHIVGLKTE